MPWQAKDFLADLKIASTAMARLCRYRLSIGLSALFRALNRNGGIASPIRRTSTFLRCGRSEETLATRGVLET